VDHVIILLIINKENIMKTLIAGLKNFINDEEGVTAIEYGLIAALIAVVIIAAVTLVGSNLNLIFSKVCKGLNNNTTC